MKIRNLRLATLLVAMVVGAQSTFATNVSTFSDLQTAIETNAPVIRITAPITDATENLKTFNSSSGISIMNNSISGLDADGTTKYSGINNTGELIIQDITLKDFSTAITNSGTLTIENVAFNNNTINFNQTATGQTTLNGTNTLDGIQGAGAITNRGNLTLSGNNSTYTGSYSQATNVTTRVEGQFFGGNSTISGGTLNWNTSNDIKNDPNTTLTMSGNSILNLQENRTLSIRSGSSIADTVTTNIKAGSNLNVAGGDVTLKQGTYAGTVNLTSGELTIDGLTNGTTGKLNATGGSLNLKSGTTTIGTGSTIGEAVKTNILANSALNISNNGTVVLDSVETSKDTWNGTINITGGELTLKNISNGILNATGGKVTLNSQTLNITGTSKINKAVEMVINSGSSVNINNNTVVLDNGDTWNGTVNLNNGTLTLDKATNNGALSAENGTLNIDTGSNITIGSGSKILSQVKTTIGNEAIVNITSGSVNLDNTDGWSGTINTNGGTFEANGVVNNGILKATTGAVNILAGKTLLINGNSSIDKAVNTTINTNAILDIQGGNVGLDSSDNWSGTVKISSGNLTIDNKQGKLNATGGNVTFEDGEFTIDSNNNISGATVTVSTPATLIFTKDDTIKNIAGEGTLKADGATLTFNNTTTLGESLKLVSDNSSKYIISSNADSILNKVKAGSNEKLTLEINGTNSTTDLNIDGTSISNLDFKNIVNYSGILTNSGEVSNSGKLTMTNSMTGNGIFMNRGELTITGDHSEFGGNFTQTAGSTTINNGGKISSGDKNINGGSLNITSGELINYDKVHLGNNASLSHTTTSEDKNIVSSSVVNFTGTGATAKFSGGKYELSEKIDNGSSNIVSFEGSTVTLGDTDFSGNTTYNFKNSTLDLLEESTAGAIKDYTFGKLTTDNAVLNFNVNIKADGTNGDRTLETDTITVGGTNNPIFKFGKIYITGEENGKRGTYSTNTNVLNGAHFATNPAKPTIIGATTTWQYDVTSANNGQSIALEITNYTDNHTLYNMNDTEGTRFFQFSENDNRVYNIAESLGETKEGTFTVSGNNKTTSVISGSDLYSMFNITSDKKDVELNISDVTLQNAAKTGNGSVVNNESTSGIVNITNAIIKNNGGDSAVHNAGILNISNTEFTGNTGKDISLVAGSSTIFEGSNKISSGITGDGSIENRGTLTLGGDNHEYTGGFTQTAGSTTVTDKFFGGNSTITSGTLNWYTTTDIESGATLKVNNGTLNIGQDPNQESVLSINNGSSIADVVTTTINAKSTLNVSGGEVTLNDGDKWLGTVNLTEGTLNVDNIKGNNKLVASNGTLNFTNGDLTIAKDSEIQEAVKTTIASTSNLKITGGTVVLDSAEASRDIWEGTITVTGGELTVKDIKSNGTINATNGTVTLESGKLDIANENSQITAAVQTTLAKGTSTNVNNNGLLELNQGDNWSGAVNVTENGILNISNVARPAKQEGEPQDYYTLTADGGTVNLKAGTIYLDSTSSITEATKTIIDGNINIEGANIQLNEDDKWAGDITITSGTLNINDIQNSNGNLIAKDGGSVNLQKGELTIGENSLIAGNNEAGNSTAVTIAQGTTLRIRGGNVTMNENDSWKGIINLKSGVLNIEETTDGILQADGGELNFNTGKLIIQGNEQGNSWIKKETFINIPGPSNPPAEGFPNGSILEIGRNGEVAVDNTDNWKGEISLQGGTLNYYVDEDKALASNNLGTLTADSGNLNLFEGSILNIQTPSRVQDAVAVDIKKGALVKLKTDATFNLDSETNDKWNGMINNSGGALTTTGLSNNTGNGGGLQQTAGSSTFKDNSHIYITNAGSYITGGDLNILNNSSLFLGAETAELRVDNLKMENNSLLNMMNDKLNTSRAENMIVNGNNNVSINIAPRSWKHDKFIINNIDSENQGNIHISDFDFLGLCPIDRHIKLQVFEADQIKNVTFDTTDKEIFTPIGWYDLKSVGGGYFTSNLTRYNPQVFRGQVSTLAMYNNQLAIDDMLLNHVTLQSERFLAQGKNANRYAITAPQFAPYQYKKEDGGLWFKNYVNFETLTMTQNLNVHNTAYGSIIGADFPVINLKRGWEYMPTAYIGYTGAQQSYSNMHMYQNGGQAGYMGTFMKHNFVGSVLAYGGAYYNEMQVAGVKDETMNWFLGTAAKAAYNIHTSEHFTIQPTAFVSYNFFNKQSWGTDFGTMSMNSGMLNGVNIAPGVNFIYARETWNIYLTLQYMYNINEGISGNAGHVQLHDIRMRHGYIQYGIGATKTWKERFNSYVQLVFRNGGRTGIGVQLGAQYLFDWYKPKKQNNKKQKSTIKTL